MNKNNIGPEGAKAIFEALKQNKFLSKLCNSLTSDMQNNSIGIEGARALSDTIKVNSTLSILCYF